MADTAAASPDLIAPPLTEVQRVIDTFTAPSKTFTDILRKATFWGPLVIMILVSIGFSYAVQQKVGWKMAFENTLHQRPQAEEQLDKLPPDQQATQRDARVKGTMIFSYGYSVLILISTAIFVLPVWVTVNFGFAGTSKYGQIFAVSMYANLVFNIKFLLAIIALFAGLAPDSFLIQNAVATNIGYFIPAEWPKWLTALCTHLDIFEIWSLILSVIGVSIVARVSREKAAVAVFSWWLFFLLIGVGITAAFS